MAAQFAEETKRRTEVWGWKDGKHETPPSKTVEKVPSEPVADKLTEKAVKSPPASEGPLLQRKSRVVMPKRRKK